MQDINDNHDPIQELPNEMFSSILSFLPPSSIAHSSAASRLWRNTILSSPTLHQEIDLTSMSSDEDLLLVVGHFVRLSSLALNQIVRLSLNLNPFLHEFQEGVEVSNQRMSAFDILLTALDQPKRSIKEIHLFIDHLGQRQNAILPFLLHLLRKMLLFKTAQLICISAPLPYSLIRRDSTGRTLSIQGGQRSRQEPSRLGELMAGVKSFGDGFIAFASIPGTLFGMGLSFEVMEKLRSSTFTMKRLDILNLRSEDPRDLLSFAIQFPNLETLRISLDGSAEGPDGETFQFQIPEVTPQAFKLKRLLLEVVEARVDWSSMSRWAGNKLKELSLTLDSTGSKGQSLLCPNSYEPLILNSRKTLTSLIISDARQVPGNKTSPKRILSKRASSSLSSLYLLHVEDSVCQVLSRLNLGKLWQFTFQSLHTTQINFEVLVKSLRKHSATLVEMDLSLGDVFDFQLPDPFDFRGLTELTIGEEISQSFLDWISQSSYPALTSLWCGELSSYDLSMKFKSTAPNLQITAPLDSQSQD